jgi:hypothetical protein
MKHSSNCITGITQSWQLLLQLFKVMATDFTAQPTTMHCWVSHLLKISRRLSHIVTCFLNAGQNIIFMLNWSLIDKIYERCPDEKVKGIWVRWANRPEKRMTTPNSLHKKNSIQICLCTCCNELKPHHALITSFSKCVVAHPPVIMTIPKKPTDRFCQACRKYTGTY